MPHERGVMSVQFDSSRNRWVVRWYEAGRQRSRRYAHETAARAFDAECRETKAAAREATAARLSGELAGLWEQPPARLGQRQASGTPPDEQLGVE